MNRFWIAPLCVMTIGAHAEGIDVFQDGPNGAKVHAVSDFVCPAKIGRFDRDAVGERNPRLEADYCAYSARDGVYGTIVLSPLRGIFDPKAAMTDDFVAQEGAGGRFVSESTIGTGPQGALAVYARIYDTAKIEAMRYRTLFACAAVENWVVRVTVEYATPRDDDAKNEFLSAVYSAALEKFSQPTKPK